MDHHRIDAIARSLSCTTTRQGAMRLLAAGFVAAVGAGSSDVATRSKKKRKNHKKGGCRGKQERCQGECRPPCLPNQRRDPRGCECECVRTACTGGKEFDLETCRCECPDGLTECEDGTCISTGICCPRERRCASGGCVPQGACCFDENRCTDGTCLRKDSGQCCPGYSVCPTAEDGCCNLLGGESCSDDGCCDTLLGEKAVCGGKCVDVATDRNHCGSCDNACAANARCVGGQCQDECPAGTQKCDGQCVDTRKSEEHCGQCGNVCPGAQECHGGQCWHYCGYNGINRACCPLDRVATWMGHACQCCDANGQNCAWPPNCPTTGRSTWQEQEARTGGADTRTLKRRKTR